MLNGFTYSSLTFERRFSCFAIIGHCPIPFTHRTYKGWCGLFSFSRRGGNVKDGKGKELWCRKGPYKSRAGRLYHQTTQEPNKPSKRTYLRDHTIIPSNEHRDWIHLNASCVQECVCMRMYVCLCSHNSLVSAAVFVQSHIFHICTEHTCDCRSERWILRKCVSRRIVQPMKTSSHWFTYT